MKQSSGEAKKLRIEGLRSYGERSNSETGRRVIQDSESPCPHVQTPTLSSVLAPGSMEAKQSLELTNLLRS